MDKQEIISAINWLSSQDNVKLQLHNVEAHVVKDIAHHFKLLLFLPEDHRSDFYFTRGYISRSGEVVNRKQDYKCCFSITSNEDFPDELFI